MVSSHLSEHVDAIVMLLCVLVIVIFAPFLFRYFFGQRHCCYRYEGRTIYPSCTGGNSFKDL